MRNHNESSEYKGYLVHFSAQARYANKQLCKLTMKKFLIPFPKNKILHFRTDTEQVQNFLYTLYSGMDAM